MSRILTVVLALAWTMAANVAHAAMQKGDVVPVAAESSLKTRPTPDADALAPAPAGASATLSVRISNTSGDWWYVEIDGKKGWLPESALAAAAPSGTPEAAPAPQAGAAPVEAAPAAPVAAVTPAAAAAPVPEARVMRKTKTAADSREIGVGFDFSKEDSDGLKSETLSLDLSYGYCLSDVHELGLQLGYFKVDFDGDSADSYLVGPFYIHNFPSASDDSAPFFGALFATTRTDLGGGFTLDGQIMEVSGGLRYFAGADFAVNFSAYYRKSDLDFEGYSFDSTTTGLRVTLSGFLR